MREIVDKIKSFISRLRDKFDGFLTEKNRWYILFGFVLLSYVYLIINVIYGDESEEKEQTALLLNPYKGGYNEVRGDPNSPSLFEWSPLQIAVIVLLVILTLFMYFYVYKINPNESGLLIFIQFALLWTHSIMLLLAIPFNKFHKRILYNTRAFSVSIVNNPLKELFIAMMFIVLLPLPGGSKTTLRERLSWLMLKLGVFYLIQSILLGKPNYTIEKSDEEVIVPTSHQDLLGYTVFFVILLILYFLY
jgi:hypothetical protein